MYSFFYSFLFLISLFFTYPNFSTGGNYFQLCPSSPPIHFYLLSHLVRLFSISFRSSRYLSISFHIYSNLFFTGFIHFHPRPSSPSIHFYLLSPSSRGCGYARVSLSLSFVFVRRNLPGRLPGTEITGRGPSLTHSPGPSSPPHPPDSLTAPPIHSTTRPIYGQHNTMQHNTAHDITTLHSTTT